MVPLTPELRRPRALLRLWLLLLLPAVAWAVAHNGLFSLTNDSCISGSRIGMLILAAACIAGCAVPSLLAWARYRHLGATSAAGERTRFMLALAAGAGASFTLVTILTSVPILLLDACRT